MNARLLLIAEPAGALGATSRTIVFRPSVVLSTCVMMILSLDRSLNAKDMAKNKEDLAVSPQRINAVTLFTVIGISSLVNHHHHMSVMVRALNAQEGRADLEINLYVLVAVLPASRAGTARLRISTISYAHRPIQARMSVRLAHLTALRNTFISVHITIRVGTSRVMPSPVGLVEAALRPQATHVIRTILTSVGIHKDLINQAILPAGTRSQVASKGWAFPAMTKYPGMISSVHISEKGLLLTIRQIRMTSI